MNGKDICLRLRSQLFDRENDRSVRASVDEDSLGTSFNIYIFVTPPNSTGDPLVGKDSLDWIESIYFAGEVAVFTGEESYGSSGMDTDIIQGFVQLYGKLKEFISSIEPDDVEKYLRDHLLWKAAEVRDSFAIHQTYPNKYFISSPAAD